MFAIFETGGKQYKVSEGDVIRVEKLPFDLEETVEMDKVLAVKGEKDLVVGKPFVDGAKVVLKVMNQAKAKKVVVFHYKPKKNIRKKQGHRQPYTELKVEKIEA